jgi:hypothetical protein
MRNSTQTAIFVMHFIIEGLLSAIGAGLAGLIYPDMYLGIISPISIQTKYAIGTFSAVNIGLGIMLCHAVYLANYKQKYVILKWYGSFLCVHDVLYIIVHIIYACLINWLVIIPAIADVIVLVPNLYWFVFGRADKYYEYEIIKGHDERVSINLF